MKLYEGKPRFSGLVNGPDYGDSKQSKVWISMSPPTPNRTEFSIQYYKIISFLKKCILKSLCIIDKNLPKYFKECFTTMFHNLKCWWFQFDDDLISLFKLLQHIAHPKFYHSLKLDLWKKLLHILNVTDNTTYICGNKREQRGEWEWSKKFGFEIEVWTVTVQQY